MVRNPAENPDQGFLIDIHVVPSGTTDPIGYQPDIQLEVVPDGAYAEREISAETDSGIFADSAIVDAVTHETMHRRNSRAQLGRHSPMQREGCYAAVRVGDFLPDFGPVTHGNFSEAAIYAANLDARQALGRSSI